MARPAPPGGSSGRQPSPNALTQAEVQSAGQVTAAVAAFGAGASSPQVTAMQNQINTQQQNVANDCLWPPSAKITVPVFGIPGIGYYHQSFTTPCLISYGMARAVFGGLLIGAGAIVLGLGIQMLALVEVGLPLAGAALKANPETASEARAASNAGGLRPEGTLVGREQRRNQPIPGYESYRKREAARRSGRTRRDMTTAS